MNQTLFSVLLEIPAVSTFFFICSARKENKTGKRAESERERETEKEKRAGAAVTQVYPVSGSEFAYYYIWCARAVRRDFLSALIPYGFDFRELILPLFSFSFGSASAMTGTIPLQPLLSEYCHQRVKFSRRPSTGRTNDITSFWLKAT